MATFGDYEPEDAWDATDTIADQLVNLFRRMRQVDSEPEPRTTDPETRLAMLEDRVRRARTLPIDPHTAHRLALIVDDIGFVRGRLP